MLAVVVPPQKDAGTTVLAFDCTTSVQDVLDDWLGTASNLINSEMAEGQAITAGCFAGPNGTLSSALNERTAPELNPAEGQKAACEAREDAAEEAVRDLRSDIAAERDRVALERVEGTNWLDALRFSAEVPDVQHIFLFTDLVQQAGGVWIRADTSDERIRGWARQWKERLKPVSESEVTIVGAGSRVSNTVVAERSRALLESVSSRAGFSYSQFSASAGRSPEAC